MTNVEQLQVLTERFEQEKDNLRIALDELTTNGAGILYEIKMIVGADTDLGQAISRCGTSVRNAATNAIKYLTEAHDKMDSYIVQYKHVNQEAVERYRQASAAIQTIDFS